MNLHIRPFTPEDYPAYVEVFAAAQPEQAATLEQVRFWDEHRDPKCKFMRFTAEVDGHTAAFAFYTQSSHTYHPHKFFVIVLVQPEYEGQGIGSALYDHVVDALQPFEPIALKSETREDRLHAVRFLQARGFEESMREWQSKLDVAAFDPSPYAGHQERVRAHGIQIKTLRELEGDPDRARKLYELEYELDQDVPSSEPVTQVDYATFVEHRFKNPGLLPDAYFIAVDGDAYVGTSALWKNPVHNELANGLTGVKRGYRRKGIALALKLRGIDYARAHGYPVIGTYNASTNRPMLSINERLGFVKQPALIEFAKVIKVEEALAPGAVLPMQV